MEPDEYTGRILVRQHRTGGIRCFAQQGIQSASPPDQPQRGKTPRHHDGPAKETLLTLPGLRPGFSGPVRVPAVSKQL